MARKLSSDLRDVAIPDAVQARLEREPRGGVELACDLVDAIERSRRLRRRPPDPRRPLPRDRRVARGPRPLPASATRRRGSARCRCRGRSAGRCRGARRSARRRSTIVVPLTITRCTPIASANSRLVPPGRSSTSFTSPVRDRLRDRTRRGRRGCPRARSPRSRRPNSCAGHLRHQLHAAFERDELAAAQRVAEERRRVRRAAHAVEVRAGVGAADHHERVVPRLGAHLPRLQVAVGRAAATGSCAGRR